jgi:hypothetical protein
MKTIIRQGIRFGALAASLLGAASASAEEGTTRAYCIPDTSKDGGFGDKDTFDPLTDPSGTLLVRGDAKITPQGTLLLTSAASDLAQSGNVTTKDQLDLAYTDAPANTKARPFHSYFTFSIGPNTGLKGGAGLTFWGHNGDAGSVGAGADGLGYGGLTTSFAIEFDTFSDPPAGGKFEDLKDNHIGFMVNGLQAEHPATFVPTDSGVAIPFATASKDKFHVWIDYEGGDSRQLDVYFSKSKDKPKTPIAWDLHKAQYASDASIVFPDNFNMADLLSKAGKLPKAYIGFSASTYATPGAKNDHIIHQWEYSTTGNTPCACQGATACAATETTPACSAGTGTMGQGICVECTVMDQSACKDKKQVCDPKTETCVGCNVGADCPPQNPVCDPAKNTCGPCTTDAECSATHPDAPVCSPSGPVKGTCVECGKDSDCKGMENVCEVATGTCILPCSKDMPCPMGWKCDVEAGRCEECAEGEVCPGPGGDIIQGGGCACSVIGLSKEEGLSTCLLTALGLASAVARRRRRR